MGQALPGRCVFPLTSFSLVERACREDAAGDRPSLSDLLRRYLPPLRAHLAARWRMRAEQAEDLLQGFVTSRILERNLIAHFSRTSGRFRSFLLTSLDNFVRNELARDHAQKRLPAGGFVNLSDDVRPVDPSAAAPDGFDKGWAREVIAAAVRQMQDECASSDRDDVWAVFQARVLEPVLRGSQPIHYEELVRRFGFRSPMQACNVLVTGKRMFERSLRSIIREYARNEAEVGLEIEELREILARGSA